MGEQRRVESWTAILRSAGLEPKVLNLRTAAKSGPLHLPSPSAVLAGHAPPETLSWSVRRARSLLRALRPDLTVFVTLRAYHPALLLDGPVPILDLVDRLSSSYRDRAVIGPGRGQRCLFRILAYSMARTERRRLFLPMVAAGRSEAEALGATWIPNVLEVPPLPRFRAPDHDLVFFGNLSYPPNVAAVERIERWMPTLRSRKPDVRVLVTGRNPDPRVRTACRRMDATLEDGYPDPITAARRGRIAVAPLLHASGIQNKVIEAAAAGVPQLLTSAALAGLPPNFPSEVADDPEAFAGTATRLLDDASGSEGLAKAAWQAACRHFTAEAWVPWIHSVVP